jgi:hypothetical protein
VQRNQFLILISSATSAILSLITYLFVKSSTAQMMITPTPTPTTNNGGVSFVLIEAAIIVPIVVVIIFLFYLKNKNKKLNAFSKSKANTIRGPPPTSYSKIDTNDKVPKPFVVFLCYKKSSGKDYADHLKTGIEELGWHTFEDCKDIPLTVNTEEGWACDRDKALEESKYFILIMTTGFNLSSEVVKEIGMARKQANKIFVFFRHRSMGRNIVVNLGDEVLDVGKLEQVSFETKEELLRLAGDILLKAKTQ